MSKVRIIIADDHQIVLDGLKLVLSSRDDFEVVAQAGNGVEVLNLLEKNIVDIVVLDINMPEMDGIKCAKKIKSLYPQVKVIILTMYAQKSFVEEIVKIGIDGCLLKNNTGKELSDAIARVHSGKSYYDQIQNFSKDDSEEKEYPLSEREIEIIRKLGDGLTSSQIADTLFISEHTVKTHRKNILKKLDLHSSSELIQYALNNGII
ncbi:two component transcriptional regulator, LuxR family [Ekhidna lutea]|uniref:Two component transcriptional regulator, LuxR family n=1 Tax=Ekhidna lutea TaxID=447679 RepID=A0A239KMN8_EKHLU|nr:response regulator transcription factor [Ekhidna lutea]SNT19421.1 two component transcriptional regulator, LuxR family [Ekhidna lutea]